MTQKEFRMFVGMPVYMKPEGNLLRGWDGNAVIGTITKIARKYFYVTVSQTNREVRFLLDGYSCADPDYLNAGYIVYPSEKAFQMDREYEKMLREVRRYFAADYLSERHLSYDEVKQVHTLITDKGEKPE